MLNLGQANESRHPAGFGRSIVLDPDKQQYVKIIGGSVDGLSFADRSMTLSSWFQVDGFNTK